MTTNPNGAESLSVLFDLFAAGQAARALLNEALRNSPLRPDEYAVYSAIADSGTHTPTSIRQRLGMPAATLSDYLNEMTGRGHLRREANPEDGRSSIVSLTRAGRAAHARTVRDFDPAVASLVQELEGSLDALRSCLTDLRTAALRALENRSSREEVVAAGIDWTTRPG